MSTPKNTILLRIGCTAIIALFALAAFSFFGSLFSDSPPITDTTKYASTIAKLKAYSPNFRLLPNQTPSQASQVQFYFDPGGFHGDFMLVLSYELPAEQVESLYQAQIASGAKFYRPDRTGNFAPGEEISLPPTVDATRYLFFHRADFEYTSFQYGYGLAVDRRSHKIFYWAFTT